MPAFLKNEWTTFFGALLVSILTNHFHGDRLDPELLLCLQILRTQIFRLIEL